MKKLAVLCVLSVFVLAACQEQLHEHVPDEADCQNAICCIECGEQLAEYGTHDYPEQPNAVKGEYSFYQCCVCGKIEIVNEDGLPVVPVD